MERSQNTKARARCAISCVASHLGLVLRFSIANSRKKILFTFIASIFGRFAAVQRILELWERSRRPPRR